MGFRGQRPVLALWALLAACAPAAPAQVVRLEGDVWAPYVMDPATGPSGFMVDVAQSVFQAAGYTVVFAATPWSRALDDLARGQADAIVGIYFTQAQQKGFVVPTQELGISRTSLYVRADSSWTYAGPRSLEGMVLGTISDYDYGELNAYIERQIRDRTGRVEVMHGDNAFGANLRKLVSNRLTVLVEDPVVAEFVARSMGLTARIKAAGTLASRNKVGIAFAPGNPRSAEYARVLSEGVARLRKSGALKAILRRYDVKDWRR